MGKKGKCKSSGGFTAWSVGLIGCLLLVGVLVPAPAAAQNLPPGSCQSDIDGVNDEPGQKDLTEFCADAGTFPDQTCDANSCSITGGFCNTANDCPQVFELHTTWNWDELSFGNQTGDACALFDTDATPDGFINAAVCVSLTGAGVVVETRVLTCDNSKARNCSGATPVASPVTMCMIDTAGIDPFGTAGDDGVGLDITATCWIDLDDFGVTNVVFLDACSYPSNSLQSAASDCVLFIECTADIDCDDSNDCTDDVCTQANTCLSTNTGAGTMCGDQTSTTCDNPNTCDGSGTCLDNFESSGTECRSSVGICDVAENCDGAGACPGDTVVAIGAPCRGSAGACDVAEACDGSSGFCPADGFASSATECRASGGICDIAEDCTGSSATCPGDAFEPASTECRASGGICDIAEDCTGSSATCPGDAFEPASTECRASGGICDIAEDCTGSSATCPGDAFEPASTECRASGGICDIAEDCTGSSATCPGDAFEPASTECRASGGICDIAEDCTGSSATCPGDAFEPASTECRASGGICDIAEDCTGSSATCPGDAFEPASTECRASGGICDIAEDCTGSSATCPGDAFEPASTECRASAGNCDVAEDCTGSGPACPADGKSTSLCRAALDLCDAAEFCDGTNNNCPINGVQLSGIVCRPGGVCDPEELCNGTDITCPSDTVSGDGDPCGDPTSNACTDPDTCDASGICQPNNQACASVTDSALCLFDVEPTKGVCVDDTTSAIGSDCDPQTYPGTGCPAGQTCVGSQFRLLFTPDNQNWPAFKLNASNPGQYYYNLVSDKPGCTAGDMQKFVITVPYPFVTHGARPVHVYDGAGVGSATGQDCFTPPVEALDALDLQITTGNWINGTTMDPNNFNLVCDTVDTPGNTGDCTFEIEANYPASCQLYVNVHLDYGLKGKDVDANPPEGTADRYDRGAIESPWGTYDALVDGTQSLFVGNVAIADCQDLDFSHQETQALMQSFSDTVQNLNEFKGVRGVLGLALTSSNGEGQAALTVSLEHPTNGVVAAGETDEDGYYLVDYKHKGKHTAYTVTLHDGSASGLSGQATLKGNGFAEVNFDVTTGTVDVVEDDTKVRGGGGGRSKPSRAR